MRKSIGSFIILSFFIMTASKAEHLSKRQIEILNMVKKVALQHPNEKGETFEKTAMSICLTESQAGYYKIGDLKQGKKIKSASLGIMQVRVQTARFIAKKLNLTKIHKMNDDQLVKKLLRDNKFNAEIAVKYLVWLSNQSYSYFKTVSRYNGGNINKPYYKKVLKNLRFIEKKGLV